MHTEIEYLGGPACGQTEAAALHVDGKPGAFRIVAIPPRYRSALDDEPVVGAEIHRYVRLGDEPDGPVWKYTWRGTIQ